MASLLTSTGIRSGLIYMIVLLMVVLGGFYFLKFKQPSIEDNFNLQAFQSNYGALNNGIRLANYHFIATSRRESQIDRWVENGIGLDFNLKGFPVGTDVDSASQESPRTSSQCSQVWQFVLSPFGPNLSLTNDQLGYWVELTPENVCVYRFSKVKNLEIHYQASEGKVTLHQIKI